MRNALERNGAGLPCAAVHEQQDTPHELKLQDIFLADSSYPYYLVSITAAKYIIAVSSVSSLQNVGEKASFRLALVYFFNNYEHSRTL